MQAPDSDCLHSNHGVTDWLYMSWDKSDHFSSPQFSQLEVGNDNSTLFCRVSVKKDIS